MQYRIYIYKGDQKESTIDTTTIPNPLPPIKSTIQQNIIPTHTKELSTIPPPITSHTPTVEHNTPTELPQTPSAIPQPISDTSGRIMVSPGSGHLIHPTQDFTEGMSLENKIQQGYIPNHEEIWSAPNQKHLGKGWTGAVHVLPRKSDSLALKYYENPQDANKEFPVAQEISALGIGPKYHFLIHGTEPTHKSVMGMEYLPNHISLGAWMEKMEPLEPKGLGSNPKVRQRALKLSADMMSKFKKLHTAGYGHGDTHLENIMVSPKGETKIIDFEHSKKDYNHAVDDLMTRIPFTFESLANYYQKTHPTLYKGITQTIQKYKAIDALKQKEELPSELNAYNDPKYFVHSFYNDLSDVWGRHGIKI